MARLTAVLACLTAACPQLLDDELAPPAAGFADAGVGGAANVGGAASTGPAGTGGSAGGGTGAAAGVGAASGSSSGCALGEFSEPELLAGLNRSGALWGPSLSDDGLLLAFAESVDDEPEDVFWSVRATRGAPFSAAAPALGINTEDSQGTTFLARRPGPVLLFEPRRGRGRSGPVRREPLGAGRRLRRRAGASCNAGAARPREAPSSSGARI
jgi:hypothetical protein